MVCAQSAKACRDLGDCTPTDTPPLNVSHSAVCEQPGWSKRCGWGVYRLGMALGMGATCCIGIALDNMKPLDSAAAAERRWQPAMASAQLDEEHWRKNGQWFSLTRPLAELVVADQDLAAAFKRCGTAGCSRCSSCIRI